MRVPFRQGLVKAGPTFLTVSAGSVSLNTTDTPLLVIISAGSKDYLWVEPQSITNAWTSIGSQNTWLYIDINARTATRTFGSTTIPPVVSGAAPATQLGKHWYDSNAHQMKVWSGTVWQPKNRVFVAKLANGSVAQSLSASSPSFLGTQVGDTTEVFAGQILFDLDDQPIKQTDGRFATTEDRLRTRVLSTAEIKLAGLQLEATAGENLSKYTVVVFSDFGVIEHASLFSPSTMGQFGIIERDTPTGELVNVVTSGVITNSEWDWTSIGVNRPLFCTSSGELSATEQIPGQNPVAVIVDRHSIQLGSPQISSGQIASTIATSSVLGYVRLSVSAANPANPIAVGSNDPRMSNARPPVAHTHHANDITNIQDLLIGYSLAAHTHTSSTITDLSSTVTNAVNTQLASLSFAPSSHTHTISDITGLNMSSYVTGPVSSTDNEIAQFSGTTGKLLKGGLTISTSTSLAGNSNSAVPTEAAVKAYVDSRPASGSGDVTGPASASNNTLALFSGTTGKVIKDSEVSITTSTTLAGNSNIAVPTEAAVKAYVDSKPAGSPNAVLGPASAIDNSIPLYDGTTGKLVKDSGITVSVDSTFASNSDTKIPTEKAIKAYVAANIGGGSPTPVAFIARSSSQTITAGSFTKIIFATEEQDTNGFYNNTTGRFQPTIAGFYQISGAVLFSAATNSTSLIAIYKNGAEHRRGTQTNGASYTQVVSALVYFNGTTDYAEIYTYVALGATLDSIAVGTYFTGVLMK